MTEKRVKIKTGKDVGEKIIGDIPPTTQPRTEKISERTIREIKAWLTGFDYPRAEQTYSYIESLEAELAELRDKLQQERELKEWSGSIAESQTARAEAAELLRDENYSDAQAFLKRADSAEKEKEKWIQQYKEEYDIRVHTEAEVKRLNEFNETQKATIEADMDYRLKQRDKINELESQLAELQRQIKELQQIHFDDQNNLNETMQEFESVESRAESADKLFNDEHNSVLDLADRLEKAEKERDKALKAIYEHKEVQYAHEEQVNGYLAVKDAESTLAKAKKLIGKWREGNGALKECANELESALGEDEK